MFDNYIADVFSPVKPIPSTPSHQPLGMASSSLMSPQLPTSGIASPSSEYMYSGKHNGLYLYFARIIRYIIGNALS